MRHGLVEDIMNRLGGGGGGNETIVIAKSDPTISTGSSTD